MNNEFQWRNHVYVCEINGVKRVLTLFADEFLLSNGDETLTGTWYGTEVGICINDGIFINLLRWVTVK